MANIGNRNTGNYNSGHYNSGDYNSGNSNSGHCNSGNRNSGNHNSGDYNSGDCNSGHCNSGNRNSGNHNSGDYNSGDCNSGHYNSGNRNSGHYNSGNYNSGFFNTDEGTVRLFNKDSGLRRSEINLPSLVLPITEWVPFEEGLSPEEARTTGGHLIKRTYKEAWAVAWGKADKELRQRFLNLPNFDADIFLEITGIDVRTEDRVKVEANGKVVYISLDSAKALGLIEE